MEEAKVNKFAKFVAIFFIFLLIISLTLAAMKKVDWIVFWVIAGISAIVAWKVMPRMKK
ncbi:hypothetical protein KY345_06990 [Candidatus Woesearchaeota archaeon]|nr:hypothetical protein [Candidatus Woesearchaeota archaeon]